MGSTILILSTPRDEHAQAVLVELGRLGAEARLLDLSEFPRDLGLTMKYEGTRRRFTFGCCGSGLELDDCGAVWWRRPQPPEVSADVVRPSHRQFALNESAEALQGLWQCLDAFWINDPTRDNVAQRKAYQLRVAQDVGLEIPATLITNAPRSAESFVKARGLGHVIYKAFSATEAEWRETRLLRDGELALIETVRYTPVIFQEYVHADVDLRITIVGDEIFPAAIHSQGTSYPVDFRIDMGQASIEPATLPSDVEARLRALMHQLGLVYGAIDMRRTPEGRHVFLEINPAGQFLFIEERTGQRIAAALAGTLASHVR